MHGSRYATGQSRANLFDIAAVNHPRKRPFTTPFLTVLSERVGVASVNRYNMKFLIVAVLLQAVLLVSAQESEYFKCVLDIVDTSGPADLAATPFLLALIDKIAPDLVKSLGLA